MNPTSNWKYINKGLLVILSVFVLATIASIIFLSSTLMRLDNLISSGSQSVRSVLVLQNFLLNLEDADTNVRGYVITGDTQYLTQYNQARQKVPATLKYIQPSTQLHISGDQITQLKRLSDTKLALMQRTVDARTTGGEEAARAIVSNGESNKLMAEIRSSTAAMSSDSLKGIGPRQKQSHENLLWALRVAAAVSVFVLGLCAVIIWYFQRSLYKERALENTKSEFLSLASHQLRTPATNVKQYVGLLLDGYLGRLTHKQHDALSIAYKNNESEIRIMNDLLDVAKLDLKRIQLHTQRVNIVSIVRQVLKEFDSYTEARGLDITLKAPTEVMAVVDREYIKGVIEKLVDNAIKYSHDRTKITVKVRHNIALSACEIIIKDNGLGIQKREISKLFMKFSRLTNEFSANTEGSGLGLYWVKQVLELHGGSIDVASQEGRGSKFTVRLPLI
jgi:signal transduction histidine kinase